MISVAVVLEVAVAAAVVVAVKSQIPKSRTHTYLAGRQVQHPSSIQYLVSSIQHPASSIQYPASIPIHPSRVGNRLKSYLFVKFSLSLIFVKVF